MADVTAPGSKYERLIAAARDGKDAAYAKAYNEKYAERLKTELY